MIGKQVVYNMLWVYAVCRCEARSSVPTNCLQNIFKRLILSIFRVHIHSRKTFLDFLFYFWLGWVFVYVYYSDKLSNMLQPVSKKIFIIPLFISKSATQQNNPSKLLTLHTIEGGRCSKLSTQILAKVKKKSSSAFTLHTWALKNPKCRWG